MQQIYIISKHTLFRKGLVSLLRRKSKYELIGQNKSIEDAIPEIQTLKPDVVIVDINQSAGENLQAVVDILRLDTKMTVVGLSLHDNQVRVYRTEKRMASGLDDLVAAIEGQVPAEADAATLASVAWPDDFPIFQKE
ncbi:MAG TPA: response regulator [Anaerolineae bacterium]|nr:response regulator [Anaerolineae bacterium]